jgi:hypothetical protein
MLLGPLSRPSFLDRTVPQPQRIPLSSTRTHVVCRYPRSRYRLSTRSSSSSGLATIVCTLQCSVVGAFVHFQRVHDEWCMCKMYSSCINSPLAAYSALAVCPVNRLVGNHLRGCYYCCCEERKRHNMCVGVVFWGTVVWETSRSRARSASVRHWPRMFGILHTVQEQQQVAVWLPERAAAAAMCVCVLSKWTHRIARCSVLRYRVISKYSVVL